jgi:hypothetical protein
VLCRWSPTRCGQDSEGNEREEVMTDRELMDRLLELRIKRLEQEIGRTS